MGNLAGNKIKAYLRVEECNTLFQVLGKEKKAYILLTAVNQSIGLLGNLGVGIAFKLLIDGLVSQEPGIIYQCAVFIFTLFLLIFTLLPYLSLKTAEMIKRKLYKLRGELYSTIIDGDYAELMKRSKQSMYAYITKDLENLFSFFETVVPEIVFCLVYFIGTFVIMAAINIFIVICILVSVSFIFIANSYYAKRADRIHQEIKEAEEEVIDTYHQTQSAVRTIKLYLMEGKVTKNFDTLLEKLAGKKRGQNYLFNCQALLNGLSADISGWGTYLLGAVFAARGIMNLGDIVLFAQAQNGVLNLFHSMPDFANKISSTIVSCKRIESLMTIEKKKPEKSGLLQNERIETGVMRAVEVEKLVFSYDGAVPVLSGGDFVLMKGSVNVLIAPVGSGKTTFIRLLTQLLQPDSGTIQIFGKEHTSFPAAETVHYVEQAPYLFSLSIRDNICLGYEEDEILEQMMICAAKKACIHDYIMGLPCQYDTVLGRDVRPSGGQRQRLVLARMFLSAAPILVFDEALSGVDQENRAVILKNILDLKEKTMLFICHDLLPVPDIDHIYYLREGKFCEVSEEEIGRDAFLASFFERREQNIIG